MELSFTPPVLSSDKKALFDLKLGVLELAILLAVTAETAAAAFKAVAAPNIASII